MATYKVFQIGSQRDVLVGSVKADNEEDAQLNAYNDFGDADDKDRGYDSYSVVLDEASDRCYAVGQRYLDANGLTAEVKILTWPIAGEVEEVYHIVEAGIDWSDAKTAALIAKIGLENEGCEVEMVEL